VLSIGEEGGGKIMKIEQSIYVIPPLSEIEKTQKGLAKVYEFPTLSHWEQEELMQDMIRAREERRLLDEERERERVQLNRQMDRVGIMGLILVALLGVAVIVAQIAIRMGW
jgi:hypothetical protein